VFDFKSVDENRQNGEQWIEQNMKFLSLTKA